MVKLQLLIFLFLVGISSTGFATDSLTTQNNTTSIPSTFGISTNILGVATLNPTLDIEYSVCKSFTIGGAVWWEVRDIRDRWAELKVTYYPFGTNMKDLGLSLTGGFHTAWKDDDAKAEIIDEETSATVGILASYSWRFLKSKSLILTPIVGIKKTFADDYDISPLQSIYPEVKINIGYIF